MNHNTSNMVYVRADVLNSHSALPTADHCVVSPVILLLLGLMLQSGRATIHCDFFYYILLQAIAVRICFNL